MLKSNKIWYGLGACATLAVAGTAAHKAFDSAEAASLLPMAAASGASAAGQGRFAGDLDLALGAIFAGEGGEGGQGLTPMWPTVTAPALTGPEIQKVVSGNTLQLPGHASYHFSPDKTVDGLYIHWDQLPSPGDCPAQNVEGSDYYLNPNNNICWKQKILPLQGRWDIREHQLCMDVSWSGGKKQGCRYVTILLDDVALFEASGEIDGKGHTLLKGKQLEQS